ncbi:MAG: DUF4136 domain-containing protein [Prevotellaceae bacterium]|jgi:hypothetical protein|nr:DUF4136 domain-containing protein [Prevotellaceae bacterium]
MKKIYLFVLMCALAASAWAQESYYYGFGSQFRNVLLDGKQTNCIVVLGIANFSPIDKANIQVFDLITAIDGEPVNDDYLNILKKKPQAVFSITRLGNQKFDVPLTAVPLLYDDCFDETSLAVCDLWGTTAVYVTRKARNIEPVEILSDPEADLYSYASFDFEFTENNTLQQKEIAVILETMLTEKGLVRDRNNPDLLVFIEYYSDKREQYVPPGQQLKTRYGIGFNWLSGNFETRQYIGSTETGDYTRVDYLSKLSIAMADAKKMQSGNNDFTVWQANYEVVYHEKANHKEFGEDIGGAMLAGFPVKSVGWVKYCHYWFTGMLFDADIPGKVAGVIPGSPADKAGIKAGDVIKKCSAGNNQIFKKPLRALYAKADKKSLYFSNYGRFELTRKTDYTFEYGGEFRGYPFVNTYMSYWVTTGIMGDKFKETNYDKNPPVFTVMDSNNKTRKVTITPIHRIYRDYSLSE